MAKRASDHHKNGKSAVDNSEFIHLKVKEFLEAGGEIQYIKSGVSGLSPQTGKKHITIASKKN